MTFLCTVDGVLTAGVAPVPGVGWPRPWALRCDDCGVVLPYGSCTQGRETPAPGQMHLPRDRGGDAHLCRACIVGADQPGLFW